VHQEKYLVWEKGKSANSLLSVDFKNVNSILKLSLVNLYMKDIVKIYYLCQELRVFYPAVFSLKPSSWHGVVSHQ
jgi:hypothetical protein